MAQVATAAAAVNLDTRHEQRVVFFLANGIGQMVVETGPASA